MMAMGLLVAGCATDDLDTETPDDVELGTTQQELGGWLAATWGTTTDMVGLDTGMNSSTTTCVLSAVRGDLGEGGYWQASTDVASAAHVVAKDGTWRLLAHGGAYTDQVNHRVWANNKVLGGAVCVDGAPGATKFWKSADGYVAAPEKIASLATNRRCFLNGVYGGGQIFTHASDYVRVRKIETVDATHPTTGWYVEGNLKSNPYTGQPAFAQGRCIDFADIDGEWGGAFGGATYTLTTGSGVKMCGLQGVYGAFNVDSWTDGVMINAPSSLSGNWTMTVSSGKFGEALCIQ
jgi:hypothetical protein